jgi:hypothetical protein
MFQSEIALTTPQQQLPVGTFLVPICTDRDGVDKLLSHLFASRGIEDPTGEDLEYMMPLLEALGFTETPLECGCIDYNGTPEDGECTSYRNTQALISFAPSDPRVDPELVPPGYNFPAWYKIPLGTDIITTLERFPNILMSPELPRFRVRFTGEGVVELHLVAVPLGGVALVTVDDNPLSLQTVGLEKDFSSIPPAIVDEIVIEVPVTGSGSHHIDVTMVPTFDDEATSPVKFGGGIRSVVLCGEDISAETTEVNIEFNQVGCQLQVTVGEGEPMTIFDSSGCGAGEGTPIEWRKKPLGGAYTIDQYILQVSVDGGAHWTDTAFNLASMGKWKTVPGVVVDTVDGDPIGDSALFTTATTTGTDGVASQTLNLRIDKTALQGEPGENGITPEVSLSLFLNEWYKIAEAGIIEYPPATPPNKNWTLVLPTGFLVDQTGIDITLLSPGETARVELNPTTNPDIDPRYMRFHFFIPRAPDGEDGHTIEIALGSLLEGDPNESPDVTIEADGENPFLYLVGFKLPRARQMRVGTVTTVSSTDSATVTYNEDEHGDYDIDYEIPRGADGLQGEQGIQGIQGLPGEPGAPGGFTLDDVPPAEGETKQYTALVLGQQRQGFVVPFAVGIGSTMRVLSVKGKWAINDETLFSTVVCGQDGYEVTPGNLIGELQIGIQAPSEASPTFDLYTDEPEAVENGTYFFLRQRNNASLLGAGWLLVTYEITMGTASPEFDNLSHHPSSTVVLREVDPEVPDDAMPGSGFWRFEGSATPGLDVWVEVDVEAPGDDTAVCGKITDVIVTEKGLSLVDCYYYDCSNTQHFFHPNNDAEFISALDELELNRLRITWRGNLDVILRLQSA